MIKGPGYNTNGTTVVDIKDQFVEITSMGIYRPSYVDVDVVINVHGSQVYISESDDKLKTAIAAFLKCHENGY